MKKFVSLLCTVATVATVTACGGGSTGTVDNSDSTGSNSSADEKKIVDLWTFNTEYEELVNNYWKPANPDSEFDVVVTVIPDQVSYMTKLQQSLQTGEGTPDIFAMDLSYVKKFVETPYLADLSEQGFDLEDVVDYTLEIATDKDGAIKGLSNQSTPGGFYYRRSIAEKYLGVSEPEDVEAYVKDWDTFIDTAKVITEKSNGEVSAVAGITDFINVFLNTREIGWIDENNNFVFDELLYTYFDVAKTLVSEGLTEDHKQWSEGWYYGMSHDTTLGYFLPAWGHPYVLTKNSEDENGNSTSGDWAVVQGPRPYFHGGTWLGMYKDSEVKEEAASVVEFFTLNEDQLGKLIEDKQDLTAHEAVNAKYADIESEFLNGQHILEEFSKWNDGINTSAIGAYDRDIKGLFIEQLTAYAYGEKTEDEAIKDLKIAVKNLIPNVNID